jgi:hypothetical protein
MTSIADSSILATLARTHRVPSPCAGKQPPDPLEERVAQRWGTGQESARILLGTRTVHSTPAATGGQRAPKKR